MTHTEQSGDDYFISRFNNDIRFNGAITRKSVSVLVGYLYEAEEESIKEKKRIKRKLEKMEKDSAWIHFHVEYAPIRLYLTSEGGEVYQALMVCDTIRHLRVPVHTICIGHVASAATLISICGAKRFITENSFVLVHQIRSGLWGKMAEIRDEAKNLEELTDHIVSLYVSRTKLTEEKIRSVLNKERTWNVAKCLEYGFVDGIIS